MNKDTLLTQPKLRIPRLISSGMVLQRDTPITIWGWGVPWQEITISFLEFKFKTTVLDSGKWNIIIPPQNAGGPYTMEIISDNKIIVSDIVIGEVWICSGQSNMGLTMSRARDLYEKEISLSYNLLIRIFTVPEKYDFNTEQDDIESGVWEHVNPENILHQTAVGYFFALSLYEKYNVPIGIIDSSVGGTSISSWISSSGIDNFPSYLNRLNKFKNSIYLEQIVTENTDIENRWHKNSHINDKGLENNNNWFIQTDLSSWKTVELPNYWADTNIGDINGVIWLKKEIIIPEELAGLPCKLLLGRIVDSDTVYVNGHLAGTTSYQYPPRKYAIPGGVLKLGQNIITIRVVNSSGKGGFIKDKPYQIVFDNKVIDLTGVWHYQIGVITEPIKETISIISVPTGLYNGMISPLINYAIRGINWYQGESDILSSESYYNLLKTLIKDWRSKWKLGDLPFLYVQLPNYREPYTQPGTSQWAELREEQQKALYLENTGMAISIDVGEWNDIHPLNKRDIGRRLSLLAQKIAYKECGIVSSGPLFKSLKKDKQRLIISFSEIGSGLTVRSNVLDGFCISGTDNLYVKAEAFIEKNCVVVWSKDVLAPVSVRYAWSDDPSVSLYNLEGLPAAPFRADIK